MPHIEVPAIRFTQDKITLFTTSMTAKDINDVSSVHTWNPRLDVNDQNQGYQRDVVAAHAKRIARFLLETDHKRIMPTAVLLSARHALEFQPFEVDGQESQVGMLRIDDDLYKVDGQHRTAGFSLAAETDPDLLGFRLPVVILQDVPRSEEIRQFYNVNATQKRVRTDLADRLLKALGEFDKSATGWRGQALEIVDSLQNDPGGPWEGRIKLPNQPTGIASQRTFTQSLRPVLIDGVVKDEEPQKIAAALTNFWSAIRNLMPEAFNDPKDYVVQKSVGVFALNRVAASVFATCFKEGNDFSVAKMETILKEAGEYMESDYWFNTKHGGKAPQYQGMGGFSTLAQEIIDELPTAKSSINV